VFGTAEKAGTAARDAVLVELKRLGLAAVRFNERHQLVLRQDRGKELVLGRATDAITDVVVKLPFRLG
jgi:hypothetical protein